MTIILTEKETEARKRWKSASDNQITRCVDSILNYETVKYYTSEKYEMNRYHEDTLKYHKEEFNMQISYQLLKAIQVVIVKVCLLIASLYCAHLVANVGSFTPGQFFWFTLYVHQIYRPLNFLGFFYQ